MIYVAEEARRLMAALGIGSFGELVGRTHLLDPTMNDTNWKTTALDLRPLLAVPPVADGRAQGVRQEQSATARRRSASTAACSSRLYRAHPGTPEPANPVKIRSAVANSDLPWAARSPNAIVTDHGPDGLPEDAIQHQPEGLGRPELRGLARSRDLDQRRGRRQRLRRQGPLRRRARRAPRGREPLRGRRQRDRRAT